MVKRSPYLVSLDALLAAEPLPGALPVHEFCIGEDGSAGIDQLPNFRLMAFWVIGKDATALCNGRTDWLGNGVFALGGLISHACLKLLRPWPLDPAEQFEPDTAQSLIQEIADGMLPLSPAADYVRQAFLCRMGEFLEIALYQPGRLPAIIANIDALSNARLTERARTVLSTGQDPGTDDLWRSSIPRGSEPESTHIHIPPGADNAEK